MLAFAQVTRQMLRYAGAGGVSALVHYAVLIGAVELGGVEPVPASVVASFWGAVVNYLLNYHLTFGSDTPHTQSLWRFALVALTGMGWNLAIMALGTQGLGWNYLLVQVLATVLVFFWNFFNNRRWTFGRRRAVE